ncbi:flagellar hook capping FlgD N-terminal domain-containing protein [Marivita sp. S2033]|uniref:flagellar hook capping FlgD N-terminal domain-containing protein n=1 Tax=Marivita sp. S2033 TaxID=3373187 RepID=UPI003981ECFA
MQVNAISAESSKAASAKQGMSGDFETFLKMLTTQIQNQDPLSPMEAEQFASQLASFSMVEQQTLTNQNFESLINVMSSRGLSNYAGLVGRTALHAGAFEFSGSPVDLELGFNDVRERSKLVILDSDGIAVSDQIVEPGQSKASWTGQGVDGLPVEPGTFTAELRSASDDSKLDTEVLTSAVIEEVRFGNDEAWLLLSDGTDISETSVARLR